MGEVNITHDEKDALAAIDAIDLGNLVEMAIRNEQVGELHRLPLLHCGLYVAQELNHFENALARHQFAKSSKKRAETRDDLRRAGHKLTFAVDAMKRRVETEQVEAQLFQIDDNIMPPYHFSRHMSVTVSYRWRRATEDQWQQGNITFTHDHDPRPDYTMLKPKRKPSAAKQEHDLQNQLYLVWEHLMRGALYSVRDFFREGGDGANIPASFQVTVDSHSRELNNYSTRFWHQQS